MVFTELLFDLVICRGRDVEFALYDICEKDKSFPLIPEEVHQQPEFLQLQPRTVHNGIKISDKRHGSLLTEALEDPIRTSCREEAAYPKECRTFSI